MSGGMVAEYSKNAFPTQSDWCGHPVRKHRSSVVRPAPLAPLIVANTSVFSTVPDDFDKMVKIFPEIVLAANQTDRSGQTAFIPCISDPVLMLVIDLSGNALEVIRLEESCRAS